MHYPNAFRSRENKASKELKVCLISWKPVNILSKALTEIQSSAQIAFWSFLSFVLLIQNLFKLHT